MSVSARSMMACVVVGLVLGAGGARVPIVAAQPEQGQAIAEFFTEYDAAFVAKDLDRLAKLYHRDVTIYEGGGTNTGWIDSRDNHIGPEPKGFNGLTFAHSNVKVQMLGPDAACVTSEYSIETMSANGPTRSGGLETDVLVRRKGIWIIRHAHTSARRQRPGGGLESSTAGEQMS